MNDKIVIVGAGLSGATLARKFAEAGQKVVVYEKRDHVGGNTYDYINKDGIMMSKYGAHIFHTSYEDVWKFVNQFSEWTPYEHKVKSFVEGKLVPIPVNIDTVNLLFGDDIMTSEDMEKWLSIETSPWNEHVKVDSRIAALQRVGRRLYQLMFENYTIKQWGMNPDELEPSVMERIPVRTDHNDRYFSDKYEAIPKYGYTKFVEKMLTHHNIEVMLNLDYTKTGIQNPKMLFFTGKIDTYFDEKFGPLEYRSLRFEHETIDKESFQEAAVVNYPSEDVPYTRIVEHKKLYNQIAPNTTITREFSVAEGEPYYPVPNEKNRALYNEYKQEAEESKDDVVFVGRLANYKYFNMDQAIKNALDIFEEKKGLL